MLITVKEPERKKSQGDESKEVNLQFPEKAKRIARKFCNPSLVLICVAGSIRNSCKFTFSLPTLYFSISQFKYNQFEFD